MIFKSLSSITLLLFLGFGLRAQNPNELFKYGSQSVDKQEFLRNYEKSNKDKVYTEAALREYLDLFTKFKLKVKDAEDQGLDTLIQVRRELAKYQNQLMESYFDKAVTNSLIEKTYDKMKEHVLVRHIFFAVDQSLPNEDTLEVYNRAKVVRERLAMGGDFKKIALEKSEDPSVKENEGLLGWLTYGEFPVFEFQEVAFTSPMGRVSKLFKSSLGYHVLRVEDKKPNPGQVTCAHILIRFREKDPSDMEIANRKNLADSLLTVIRAGADFKTIAEQYSNDKSSYTKGGELPPFGIGRMFKPFEDAAFGLSTDGQVTGPIQTQHGWHIIKRISRSPMASQKEMKPLLKNQVLRGPEYAQKKRGHIKYFADKGNLLVHEDALARFSMKLDSALLRTQWKARFTKSDMSPLITLGGTIHPVASFADYLELNQRQFRARTIQEMVDKSFEAWREKVIMDYSYELADPAYRPLMQEYRDGILLFELTERKVWSKALRDTMGLAEFYNNNLARYGGSEKITFEKVKNSEPSKGNGMELANARIYECSNMAVARSVYKEQKRGTTSRAILDLHNPANIENVSLTQGQFARGENSALDQAWEVGIAKAFEHQGKFYTLEITSFSKGATPVDRGPKTKTKGSYPQNFLDKRGAIIADYQKYLEDQWMMEMKAKYPITINEAALKSLVR